MDGSGHSDRHLRSITFSPPLGPGIILGETGKWIRNSCPIALLLEFFARIHIWVYRPTDGRIGVKLVRFPAGLLTTTGRKSDRPRTTATLDRRDAER